jgi:hypothetical protein
MQAWLKRTAVAAAMVLAAVSAGGCGNDRSEEGPIPSPTPPSSPPQAFPQPPRGAVLARLDCRPENFPACGWGDRGTGEGSFTATLQVGQGPRGADAVQFTQLAGPTRQYYMGWGTPETGDEPPGTMRFIRVRVWIPGPSGQLSGYHGAWDAKFLILGDGGNGMARVICNLRDNGQTPDTMSVECQRNIDGGTHSTGLLPLTLGTWHDIQVEARSGPAASIAVWIDNNDYARPNGRTTGQFSLDTTNWRFLGVGYYAGTPRAQNQDVVAIRIADDVEFGTGFDPTWHR